MVFGMLAFDQQPPVVGVGRVQLRVVFAADPRADVRHGEDPAVEGILNLLQISGQLQPGQIRLADAEPFFVFAAEMTSAFVRHRGHLGDRFRRQAGPAAGPARPGGDDGGHRGEVVLLVQHDRGGQPVVQEPLQLSGAHPQRPAGVSVGAEVDDEPGAAASRGPCGKGRRLRGRQEVGDDRLPFVVEDSYRLGARHVGKGLGQRTTPGEGEGPVLDVRLGNLG